LLKNYRENHEKRDAGPTRLRRPAFHVLKITKEQFSKLMSIINFLKDWQKGSFRTLVRKGLTIL